ncbi:MAG: S9 family peptidase, partial [Opitutaceae bacterium]|nr:S9 family peptidase [Opitutaceae bacterium]
QDNRTWHPVKLDLLRYDVAGIDPDNRRLWISHYRPETGFVLQRLDPVTGALEDPVWLDPDYDLGNCRLYFSPRTGNLVGLAYHQKTLVSAWFDDLFRAAHATVSERYPERTVALVDFDEAEKRFVYHVASPDDPGRHVLLDLERRSVGTLSVTASWLDGRPLRPMQPVSFRTRDGLRLEGYLTLPAEASTEHRVPLVVLVHGGPWVRDTWQYDPLVQFLASRGYAVFQPNYRGSTGYTPAVSTESRFAFRRMHDDVTDATRSAARFEVIDGQRVAIIGGSFGGFLAAAGVAFEPDLYRCAATFAGVFDWEMLIRSKRSDGRPGEYERLIDELGRPGKDRDAFTAISPLAHADAIKVPMLVAHGREDRIVPVAQSKRLIASLRQRNIPHETYLLADGTHGMAERKQRIEYYRRLESFLARYLRDAPPAPPP